MRDAHKASTLREALLRSLAPTLALSLTLVAVVSVADMGLAPRTLTDVTCDAATMTPSAEATVLAAHTAGAAYVPFCAVIANGGTATLYNPDPVSHNPASKDATNVQRPDGSCFRYSVDHFGMRLMTGGSYALTFRFVGDELHVSPDRGHTWRVCEPSEVRDNGDVVVAYACVDHWSTTHGYIVISRAVQVDPPTPATPHVRLSRG